MPDFDFSTDVGAIPRQQTAADSFMVMKEGSPDVPGLVNSFIQQWRNQAGTSYTFTIADSGLVLVSTENNNPIFTIPLNAAVAFNVGTEIVIDYRGTGLMKVQILGVGIINNITAGSLVLQKGQQVVIWKTATDTWEAVISAPNPYAIAAVFAAGTFNL